jgi:hypothetical protein
MNKPYTEHQEPGHVTSTVLTAPFEVARTEK